MKSDRCCFPNCRAESTSVQIISGKKFGYCDKHLEIALRKQERESQKRFSRYQALSEKDPVNLHIEKYGGAGGSFIVWPISFALDTKE